MTIKKTTNKGGRPKGSGDLKPRKRRGKAVVTDPWAEKKKTKRSETNKRLLLSELEKFNFDLVSEILHLYDNIKAQGVLIFNKELNKYVMAYEKNDRQQMIDILKVLVTHSYPKLKSHELSTRFENPISLEFHLGGNDPKKIEQQTKEENKEQAIDLVKGPGGFQIPILKPNTERKNKGEKEG